MKYLLVFFLIAMPLVADAHGSSHKFTLKDYYIGMPDSDAPVCTTKGDVDNPCGIYNARDCSNVNAKLKQCTMPGIDFGNYAADLTVYYLNHVCQAIYVTGINNVNFDQVKAALISKYGRPKKDQKQVVHNHMGAKFTNETLVWLSGGEKYTFTKMDGRIDRGSAILVGIKAYKKIINIINEKSQSSLQKSL